MVCRSHRPLEYFSWPPRKDLLPSETPLSLTLLNQLISVPIFGRREASLKFGFVFGNICKEEAMQKADFRSTSFIGIETQGFEICWRGFPNLCFDLTCRFLGQYSLK